MGEGFMKILNNTRNMAGEPIPDIVGLMAAKKISKIALVFPFGLVTLFEYTLLLHECSSSAFLHRLCGDLKMVLSWRVRKHL
ncbi:hypothetical protein CEXT_653081 [Caerostris extrusa]|uniref:Uncharacterized protein n=1 Tax=Caerostris extrusa TaxID=172846 RepID=A0AAV4USH9_CAEEX|nr:hypothetical protein CEXT_653081 [Caerostris extrusa]